MPKNLSSDAFKKLLNALSEDEAESAILYTKMRDSLVRFFTLKGMSEADEAADETIDRVAEKINQNTKIENLTKFAFGVARFVFLENLRKQQSRKRAVDTFYLKDSASREFDETDEIERLRDCFESLYERERALLVSYFEDLPADELFAKRQKIAEDGKLELNALRNRVSRLRKRLEDCIGKHKK